MTRAQSRLQVPPRLSTDSEKAFRLLVDSVRDYAIFLLDPGGHVVTWNAGAHRFKGYIADEIVGKHFSVFYPEAEKKAKKPEYELKMAAKEGRFEDEGWRIRKDGTRFWANVVITAIRDETGELIGFGKITRDLSERKLAEERYRLLIEGVTDYAIYSLDLDGNVTTWNNGAEGIKGYTSDEIVGQHFSRFYTREDAAAGLPQRVLQAAREHGHYEGEGWRVRKDGSRFWSSVVVTALKNEEGEPYGFSKITRDITDRKQLMDQIKEHADDLETEVEERKRINADLEAFSYSVSHDLRAPLRTIEGFAVALVEDYGERLDAKGHEYLKEITDAAVRMNRLVQDLLEYGRLSRGEMVLEPVPVAGAVAGALKELAEPAADVQIRVPHDAAVRAHTNTLVHVLFNLISNGLKFHAPGVQPRVEIQVGPGENGFSRISVIDNGIGIAPQHHARIFQVFERLHGPETYPGTGIGLAIVKRGIERMGGRYGLESQVGKGSTFWVELPAANVKE